MDIAKHWKTIFDTLQDGLMVVDPGGKIIAVNPSAERLTGFDRKELVGKSCRILNCTGCKITKQPGELNWCGLFKRDQGQKMRHHGPGKKTRQCSEKCIRS